MSYKLPHHKPKPVLGYTTRRHLLLDLDNATLYKTQGLTRMLMKQYPKIGDALILLSSIGHHKEGLIYTKFGRPLRVTMRDNYHVVFDNGIGYNLCVRIIHVLANLHILERDYVKIRHFRGDMTLRISDAVLTDKHKPLPTPVAYVKNPYSDRCDGFIDKYLDMLRISYHLFPEAPTFDVIQWYNQQHQTQFQQYQI